MKRLGQQTFHIELIEDYPYHRKAELNKREGFWVRELKATLNKVIPGRTEREYKDDNKTIIKEYRDTHKDQRKEYLKRNKEIIQQ